MKKNDFPSIVPFHGDLKRAAACAPGLPSEVTNMNEQRLARALGWFGFGLGLAELATPGYLVRALGIRAGGTDVPVRALGLREIASSVGVLTRSRPAGWLWGRVAGDAMDVALLGVALTSTPAQRPRVALAAASVLGVTVLDVACSGQLSRRSGARTHHAAGHRSREVLGPLPARCD